MGMGDYVSSNTEHDVAAKEKLVTEWDVTNRRRLQEQSLLDRYRALGMNHEDATMVTHFTVKTSQPHHRLQLLTSYNLQPPFSPRLWKSLQSIAT